MSTIQLTPKYYIPPSFNTDDRIKHQDDELARDLRRFLVEDYHHDLVWSESALDRMDAARKIAKWGEYNSDKELLKSAVRKDRNPNVRAEALKAIETLIH